MSESTIIAAVELESFGEGIPCPPETVNYPVLVEPVPTWEVPLATFGFIRLQHFMGSDRQLRMNMAQDMLIALPEAQLREFEQYEILCNWDDVYKLDATKDIVIYRVHNGVRGSWFFNLLTNVGKRRIDRLLSTPRNESYESFVEQVQSALKWTHWNQDPIYTAAVMSCLVENYVEDNPKLFHSQFGNAKDIIDNLVARKGWVNQWESGHADE